MNYTAVNAKIRVMRSRLLTGNDYSALLFSPPSDGKMPAPEDDFAKISAFLYKKSIRDFAAKINTGVAISAIPVPDTLDKSCRESLKRVGGVETDLRNILWIYRLKKYHNINGDAVFSFLNPVSYRLKPQDTAILAHAKNLDFFAQSVAAGAYGELFPRLPDFARGEQLLTHAVRKQFKKESRFENLSVVCGYLYERQLETKNLSAIHTGLKNGLTPEEIYPLLHL